MHIWLPWRLPLLPSKFPQHISLRPPTVLSCTEINLCVFQYFTYLYHCYFIRLLRKKAENINITRTHGYPNGRRGFDVRVLQKTQVCSPAYVKLTVDPSLVKCPRLFTSVCNDAFATTQAEQCVDVFVELKHRYCVLNHSVIDTIYR